MDIAAAGRAKNGPTDDVVEHSLSDDGDDIASGARSAGLSSYSGDTPEGHRSHEVRHFRSSSRGMAFIGIRSLACSH